MNKKIGFISQILSVVFFLLFMVEVFILPDYNLSFRGVITEKIFYWLWICFGFYGFGIKYFSIGLGIFLGLAMLPMFIPFIVLLNWSTSINKYFPQPNSERIEEVPIFGQHRSRLYIIKPFMYIFEKSYYSGYMDKCNFGNLDDMNLLEMKHIKISIISEDSSATIRIAYSLKDGDGECITSLKKED